MPSKRVWQIGGFVAGAILIAFGVVAIYMGVDGRSTVRDSLKQEQIHFGSIDDPAVAKHAEQWAAPSGEREGDLVATGEQARAFASIMREHALEASGGLTYAQMGRYVSAANPDDPAGTDELAAAKTDARGNPVPNAARETWVTETALSTALNVSYMAEQLALFGMVVGVALLLTGVGLVILAFAVFGRRETVSEAAPSRIPGATATG